MIYTIRCLKCESKLGWGRINQSNPIAEKTSAYCQGCAPMKLANTGEQNERVRELKNKIAAGVELKKHDLRLLWHLQSKALRAGRGIFGYNS